VIEHLGGKRDMTESNKQHVVIAGGGVAGLEALLALHALAGDRVELTLVAPNDTFIDRPMTVAEPFGFGSVTHLSLPEIAAEVHAEFVQGAATGVDAENHRLSLADGRDLAYDKLILALGAHPRAPFGDAITFGTEGSREAVEDLLDRLRTGQTHSVAFVAPAMTGWILPVYELALMTARELHHGNVEGVELRVLTPEDRPLALFGGEVSRNVGRLLAAADIDFIQTSFARLQNGGLAYGAIGQASADSVVTLPLLSGPELAGVPATGPEGFIPVDEYGRVKGLTDVYAAGDATEFPVKQGGLAAQQADTVATHIAAEAGADVEPEPFEPVLRGMLFTGDDPLYMRSGVPGSDPAVPGAWYPLWWPPTKVAGRYLPPYLLESSKEELSGPPMGFVDVDIPLSALTLPG
jgi:sulfide:quinone oxidoreductase